MNGPKLKNTESTAVTVSVIHQACSSAVGTRGRISNETSMALFLKKLLSIIFILNIESFLAYLLSFDDLT